MKLSAVYLFWISLLCISMALTTYAQEPQNLPLFSISDLTYDGAFRLPSNSYGPSSLNYSEGPIAYNADNHSLFIVGHIYEQAIAEFSIPALVNSNLLSDLNMAAAPLQNFTEFLNATPDGNPELLDRIGGMYYYGLSNPPKLFINAYEYYDAPADNVLSTFIVNDATDLSSSAVSGYFSFTGEAGHTCGWISDISSEWQDELEGNLMTGQSSGLPIISRLSVGPSAFSFNAADLLNANDTVSSTALMDFSLYDPLHADLSNDSLTNDLWTHLSRAAYGFTVPMTRSYMTIGHSGGHSSGVCYKCDQNNGIECPGYCAPDTADYDYYYWLWDMNDFLDVKDGLLAAYDIQPYDYGVFTTPFQNSYKQIGGGSYDPISGQLYLSIQRADNQQGYFDNPPVIAVYNTNSISSTDIYLESENISLFPNPTEDTFEIRGLSQNYTIEILDENGALYQNVSTSASSISIDISNLPSGLFFIKARHQTNNEVLLKKIVKM